MVKAGSRYLSPATGEGTARVIAGVHISRAHGKSCIQEGCEMAETHPVSFNVRGDPNMKLPSAGRGGVLGVA